MPSKLLSLLCIFVGGGAGASLRLALSLIDKDINDVLPGTFAFMHIADILSCAIIGALTCIQTIKQFTNKYFAPLVTTGFLGGLSSFSVLAILLAKSPDFIASAFYIAFELLAFVFISSLCFALTYLVLAVFCKAKDKS